MAVVDMRVTARGVLAQQPWLWRLCREFDVEVTVTKANVDSELGFMELKVEGAVEEIQRATAWLMTTGVHVNTQQRAVGA